ncbi:hypothetical protein BKA66DRAFT_452388 [Pyrenochaeta sp. MPI-SDFR-AT-0127]|nr:hypothetical protein BKA66DRAFT_452388 [Pyrenochaeta sp. MPI-SDFR-AT-0127]
MGGHITLPSSPGEGTSATCNYPFLQYHSPDSGLLTETSLPHQAHSSDKVKNASARPECSRDPSHKTLENKLTRSSMPSPIPTTEGHILLIEDNPVNRKVIALAMKKLDYEVSIICNSQGALDYHCKQSVQPRPHAVLMDCMMPVVDGYEATRRICGDND